MIMLLLMLQLLLLLLLPITPNGPVLLVVTAAPFHTAPSASLSQLRRQPPPPLRSNPPIGLVNLGNTCYLNSQLQCAYSIPKVRELLLSSSLLEQSDEDAQAPQQQQQQTLSPRTILAALFAEMMMQQQQQERGTVTNAIAPRMFCRALGIPVYEQQDAQEFWKLLLPTLSIPAILDLYKGELETYIRTMPNNTNNDKNGREKRRKETYLDLSLDMGSDDVRTVEEAIVQTYLTPEQLLVAEGNGWRPEKGEPPVDATKGAILYDDGDSGRCRLPSVLQLHLKRFQYDWQTGMMSKVNKRLSFPLDLQLPVDSSSITTAKAPTTTTSTPWSVPKAAVVPTNVVIDDGNDDDPAAASLDGDNNNKMMKNCQYVLQAVVVHAGEYGAGHYYSYVRSHPMADTWFRCNDDVIEVVSWEEVTRDAFGGRYETAIAAPAEPTLLSSSSSSNLAGGPPQHHQRSGGNPLVRFFCNLLHQLGLRPSWMIGGSRSVNNNDPYGYGGRTSSAYVLQYVRRCQIDVLFGS